MQSYRSAGGICAAYHGQPIIQYNIGTSTMCLQEHTSKLSKRSIERSICTYLMEVYAQHTTTNLYLYMLLVQAQCVYRSILHKLSKRSLERCNIIPRPTYILIYYWDNKIRLSLEQHLSKLSERNIERCNCTDPQVVNAQHTTANL